jgi:acetyl-CoA synthetase
LLRDDGSAADVDELGEIAVRRGDPGMFLGYLDDPTATDNRFRGDWLMTGDLAVRDRDGYVFYRGRADDVFNTSGYRVGPTEIEHCLATHPAVEHAAVVGEADSERGEIVKAFIVVRQGVCPSAELSREIQTHVKSRLAAYEYPRRIVFARELPMTPSGKIRRAELRAPGADETYGLPRET